MAALVWRPSPNFNERPHGAVVSCVVMHADGDASIDSSIDFCCRTDAERRVSYHTIVGRTGNLFALVSAEKRAWHAGVATFDGHSDVNGISVGVCLGNRQDGREPFPEAQLAAAAVYVAGLVRRFPAITVARIVTHAQVALPPGRKCDPAPAGPFDLADFRRRVTAELAR